MLMGEGGGTFGAGTPPMTALAFEAERLRAIAEKQGAFIEEIAHFAPGRLGVRARDLLVETGAWRHTVERDTRPDPIVAKLRAFAQHREEVGHDEAAAEIQAI